MGYETTLIFIDAAQEEEEGTSLKGYFSVIGSFELFKIADHLDKLISSIQEAQEVSESDKEDVKKYEEQSPIRSSKLNTTLGRKFPYIYWDNTEKGSFTDSYGDFLLIASVEDVKKAIIQDGAEDIKVNGKLWDVYDSALKVLGAFEGRHVKVVLWGH